MIDWSVAIESYLEPRRVLTGTSPSCRTRVTRLGQAQNAAMVVIVYD